MRRDRQTLLESLRSSRQHAKDDARASLSALVASQQAAGLSSGADDYRLPGPEYEELMQVRGNALQKHMDAMHSCWNVLDARWCVALLVALRLIAQVRLPYTHPLEPGPGGGTVAGRTGGRVGLSRRVGRGRGLLLRPS